MMKKSTTTKGRPKPATKTPAKGQAPAPDVPAVSSATSHGNHTMATTPAPDFAQLVEACRRLGEQAHAISRNPAARRLNRDVWLSLAVEMAGCADLSELEALRQRAQGYSNIWNLIGRVADGFNGRHGGYPPEGPRVHDVFVDPDREPRAAYEILRSGLTCEQCSGVAALVAAEDPRAVFGTAGYPGEADDLLADMEMQLSPLARQLAVAPIPPAAVSWRPPGIPFVALGAGVEVEVWPVENLGQRLFDLAGHALEMREMGIEAGEEPGVVEAVRPPPELLPPASLVMAA